MMVNGQTSLKNDFSRVIQLHSSRKRGSVYKVSCQRIRSPPFAFTRDKCSSITCSCKEAVPSNLSRRYGRVMIDKRYIGSAKIIPCDTWERHILRRQTISETKDYSCPGDPVHRSQCCPSRFLYSRSNSTHAPWHAVTLIQLNTLRLRTSRRHAVGEWSVRFGRLDGF